MTNPISNSNLLAGFIFGRGISLAPRPVVKNVLKLLLNRLHACYPGLQKRLSGIENTTFLLLPTDMPFNVLLHIKGGRLRGDILPKEPIVSSDVTIRSTSHTFIALLEGSEDGDALFFSRHLEIEGNTEALLILRNSFDSESLNLKTVFYSAFGPFSAIVARIARPIEHLGTHLMNDINILHQVILSPLLAQERELGEKLLQMEKRLNKTEFIFAQKTARNQNS